MQEPPIKPGMDGLTKAIKHHLNGTQPLPDQSIEEGVTAIATFLIHTLLRDDERKTVTAERDLYFDRYHRVMRSLGLTLEQIKHYDFVLPERAADWPEPEEERAGWFGGWRRPTITPAIERWAGAMARQVLFEHLTSIIAHLQDSESDGSASASRA